MAIQAMSVEALPHPGTAPTTFDHLLPTGRERTLAATVVGIAQQARPVHVANAFLRTALDQDTIDHEVRVTATAVIVGSRMGLTLEQLVPLAIGGLCHDIGKADPSIQPYVKSPTNLRDPSVDEKVKKRFRRALNSHAALGAAMLDRLTWQDSYQQATAVALAGGHHTRKKQDPYGIEPEEEFKEAVEVLAVSDMLDAVATARAYKEADAHDTVQETVSQEFRGDPTILDYAFPDRRPRATAML